MSRYADGDVFEGEWKAGVREGMGEILFINGDYYRGQWTGDEMSEGFGKFTYPDGTVYLGEVRGGSTVGRGRIVFPDADATLLEDDLEEGEVVGRRFGRRKFRFYFYAMVLVLSILGGLLLALFVWWLICL